MTLGALIDALKSHDPSKRAYFDFVHFQPEGVHSYRGYYDHLAIGYGRDGRTVGQLLELCEGAVGKTFEGYKGGDYTMTRDTPVWVANHNESGGTAIVRVRDEGWRVLLETASID